MNKKQQTVLIGMILGDAFLQKTGENNARIRLEHSEKQKDYLLWKANFFPEFFQGKHAFLERYNPVYKKAYRYVRWQSNASPEIGKFRKIFYNERGRKVIPEKLGELFKTPLSLAVWYFDDGYLYHRDKMAYIYLPKLSFREVEILLEALEVNFELKPLVKTKSRGNQVLVFPVEQTGRLNDLVSQFAPKSMQYKLLNPVSTETLVSR